MQVMPNKRLSITQERQVAPVDTRNSFEHVSPIAKLDQTFDQGQYDRVASNSGGADATVMWGYSPNFNLKKQKRAVPDR